MSRTAFAVLAAFAVAAGPTLAQNVLPPGAARLGTPGPTIVLQRPDLTVTLQKVTYAPDGLSADHVYTVSNIGVAGAPATKLKFVCEVLYAQTSVSRCGAGSPAPAFYNVPALAKGGSTSVTISPAAFFKTPALPVKSPPLSYWRFRFTVTVDPDNTILEANEANNTYVHVSESWDGPVPTPTPMHGPPHR
jgi:hypothetical protein